MKIKIFGLILLLAVGQFVFGQSNNANEKVTNRLMDSINVNDGITTFKKAKMQSQPKVKEQEKYALKQGSAFISGMGSINITSTNTELVTDISLSPSYNYFVFSHFYVGGALNYCYQNSYDPATSWISIGPQIGCVLGNRDSDVYPFVNFGVYYQNNYYDHKNSWDDWFEGKTTSLSVGIIVPIVNHLGFSVEGKYNNTNFYSIIKANQFFLNFGLVGMIF